MKKSNLFIILFVISLVITIIFAIFMIKQSTDTSVNLDDELDLEYYKEMADFYKSNNDNDKYEETIKEIDEIESNLEEEQKSNNIVVYGTFISGGIMIIFLATGIVLKVKEKRKN